VDLQIVSWAPGASIQRQVREPSGVEVFSVTSRFLRVLCVELFRQVQENLSSERAEQTGKGIGLV